MALPPNPTMRNPASRFFLTGEQRQMIDDAVQRLPADSRHAFTSAIFRCLRECKVHGQAQDFDVKLALKTAGRQFNKPNVVHDEQRQGSPAAPHPKGRAR
jgi:hypothetical protein